MSKRPSVVIDLRSKSYDTNHQHEQLKVKSLMRSLLNVTSIRKKLWTTIKRAQVVLLRRPLRMYLYELLLGLTAVTFFIQMCCVVIPIEPDVNQETPDDIDSRLSDTPRNDDYVNMLEGIIHIEESSVDLINAKMRHKHRLKRYRTMAADVEKVDVEAEAEAEAEINKPDTPNAEDETEESPPEPKNDDLLEAKEEIPPEPKKENLPEMKKETLSEVKKEIPSEPKKEIPSEPKKEIPSEPRKEIPSEPEKDIPSGPKKENPSEPKKEILPKTKKETPSEPKKATSSKPREEISPKKKKDHLNYEQENQQKQTKFNAKQQNSPINAAENDHKENPPKLIKGNVPKTQNNLQNAQPAEPGMKLQNPGIKQRNTKFDVKLPLQKNQDAKPYVDDVKSKSIAVNAEAENDANVPIKVATKPRRTIMALGRMQIIEKWSKMSTLVRYLKENNPKSDGMTYRVTIECSDQPFDVDFTFSANPDDIAGKDAVVLNMAPYTLQNHISSLIGKEHDRNQLWMFYGVETALRIHKWIKNVGSLEIHGVWSYLSNSEIHMPYAYYQPGPPVTDTVKRSNKFWTRSKNNSVAWMGSNCVKEVFWPRMQFIEELAQHISVHTYGKCGNRTCLPRMSEECQNLMSSYKFYLAFENAECDEYITEKMWDTALQHGVVPVVYGARKTDYQALAPPNSFIYAGDFETAKDLANYLLKLERRPELYAKYFQWRHRGSVVQVYPELQPSDLCTLLPHIDLVQKGELEKKPLYNYPWFNSCRNKIESAFNPKDIPPLDKWTPW